MKLTTNLKLFTYVCKTTQYCSKSNGAIIEISVDAPNFRTARAIVKKAGYDVIWPMHREMN